MIYTIYNNNQRDKNMDFIALIPKQILNILGIFILLELTANLAGIPKKYRHLFFSWFSDIIICFLIWQDSWDVIKDRSVVNMQWSNSLSLQIIAAVTLYDVFINKSRDAFYILHHLVVMSGLIAVYALHSKLMNFLVFAACGPFGVCIWTIIGLRVLKMITRVTEKKAIYYINAYWRWPLVLITLYEGAQLINQGYIHPLFLLPIVMLFISIQMVTKLQAEAYFKQAVITGQ